MEIYKIIKDGSKYQELDLEVNDFINVFPEEIDYGSAHDFSIDNMSLAKFWKPLRTGFSEIEGKENLIPDITTWIDATLLLSPKSYRYLGDLLAPYGEFLPVHIEHEVYRIFNCLTSADVAENYSSDSHIEFDKSTVSDKLVFKTSYQYCMNVYCQPRLKEIITSFGLRGVCFETKLGLFEP